MCGLGESILLEGETTGVTRSAKVFKAIQAGETDNNVIAALCGCTVENVVRIREEFGI